MNQIQTKSIVLLGLVAGTLLSGCGGSGGGGAALPPATAQPAATVIVNADVGTIAWNAPAAIDVLSNDSASRGALTLSAVSGALHGTAAVANGKVSYTPAPGFYGAEKLSYTVTATEGGATANGELLVSVEAVLTLNGNASDSPLANAGVTAAVGAKNFSATTNATGDFSVVIRSTTPLDFVTLTATGSGAQAPVKLVSLVGDIDALVKSADAQGQVSKTAVPRLAVSHYSTAFMALSTKALNGTVPNTALQLRDVAIQVPATDVLYMATAIRLVADKGVALPVGIADTLALVQSPAGVAAVYAAANTLDPLLAGATRTGVDGEVNAGSPFTLDGLAEHTIAYDTAGLTVTYRADGTGRMSGRYGERNIKWVASGTTVRLTYEQAVEWIYDAGALPINGGADNEYAIRELSEGMVIQSVLNDTAVKWGETGSVTWKDGPNAGKPVAGSTLTTTNVPTFLSNAWNADRRLPLDAAMTAVGNKLFGAISTSAPMHDPSSQPGMNEFFRNPAEADMLEFTSATQARFGITQETVSWSVKDDWLSVTHANGTVWRFGMLGKNAVTGRQIWLAEVEAVKLKKVFIGFAQPAVALKFTSELALRKWNFGWPQSLAGQPNADGTVTSASYSPSSYTSTWEITSDGDLVIKHVLKSTGQLRRMARYVPIKLVGERLWLFGYDTKPTASSTFVGYIEIR